MTLRMAGIAAAALTVVALVALIPPRYAGAAPRVPTLVVTQRAGGLVQNSPPTSLSSSVATCLTGETVVGGGFRWGEYNVDLQDFAVLTDQNAEVARSTFYVDGVTPAWRAEVVNTSLSATIDVQAYAMCGRIQ